MNSQSHFSFLEELKEGEDPLHRGNEMVSQLLNYLEDKQENEDSFSIWKEEQSMCANLGPPLASFKGSSQNQQEIPCLAPSTSNPDFNDALKSTYTLLGYENSVLIKEEIQQISKQNQDRQQQNAQKHKINNWLYNQQLSRQSNQETHQNMVKLPSTEKNCQSNAKKSREQEQNSLNAVREKTLKKGMSQNMTKDVQELMQEQEHQKLNNNMEVKFYISAGEVTQKQNANKKGNAKVYEFHQTPSKRKRTCSDPEKDERQVEGTFNFPNKQMYHGIQEINNYNLEQAKNSNETIRNSCPMVSHRPRSSLALDNPPQHQSPLQANHQFRTLRAPPERVHNIYGESDEEPGLVIEDSKENSPNQTTKTVQSEEGDRELMQRQSGSQSEDSSDEKYKELEQIRREVKEFNFEAQEKLLETCQLGHMQDLLSRQLGMINQKSQLNIMTVGPSGVGKTSFIKLFLKKFNYNAAIQLLKEKEQRRERFISPGSNPKDYQQERTSSFEEYTLSDDNKCVLKMIDSCGYDNNMDLDSWADNIKKYIISKIFEHHDDVEACKQKYSSPTEYVLQQGSIKDERVHLLLYFFDGRLSISKDINVIQKLERFVNVIPIVSKADSFTADELMSAKRQITSLAKDFQVEFFECYQTVAKLLQNRNQNEQQAVLKYFFDSEEMGYCPPFAIINDDGCEDERRKQGASFESNRQSPSTRQTEDSYFGRKLHWGFVESCNERYSDFPRFYKMIINFLWIWLINITQEKNNIEAIKKLKAELNASKLSHTQSRSRLPVLLLSASSLLAMGAVAILGQRK